MDQKIVRAAIHPAIGVARVGNSPSEYFYGPEVPYPTSTTPGFYRDGEGALKRQAARFRIYGYNIAGQPVREITSDMADIRWTVEVANKKAAWFNFETAMDLPQAIPCGRRNGTLTGANRNALIIKPASRSVSGPNQSGSSFDTGEFLGEPVYLGELRTDEAGRLVFLGGYGRSGTPLANNTIVGYANNDGWYDDTSDGPVSAEVKLGGKPIPVDPAWVVVAPPNFAPDIISIQTMYDVIYDACAGLWLNPPAQPSFTANIYPLLHQFSNYQWVNKGFAAQFGWRAPYDFLQHEWLAKLSQSGSQYAEIRLQIFRMFINPNEPAGAAPSSFPLPAGFTPWPQVYGDAPSFPTSHYFSLTATQYNFLQQWANGQFVSDWNPNSAIPESIQDLPLSDQPGILDKAALFFCMGGPFHPGGEMPWAMRQSTMYRAAFRIRSRGPHEPEPDLGAILTPAMIQDSSSNRNAGPLYANGPGDITRWMAIPWQADSASCRAGYNLQYDPYLPTFWPARVPNDVLTEESYQQVMNASLPKETRIQAFLTRQTWYRWLGGAQNDQMNQMVDDFHKLGVVERRNAPPDGDFPKTMYVESLPRFEGPPPDGHVAFVKQLTKVKPL